MRFKVYFSRQQMMSRSTNVIGNGDNRFPVNVARLTNGSIVPYTQLADEKANYGCKWDDAIYLEIAYREDIAGLDYYDPSDIVLGIDELEPVEEK